MKEIRAYIQPFMLTQVTHALLEIPDFPGMSVSDCDGFGRERAEAGNEYHPFYRKKRIEIFAPDAMAETIFNAIMAVAHTSHHGDGKVYMLNAIQGGRISSGEKGPELA